MAAPTPGKLVYTGRHVIATFDLNRKGIAACALGNELRNSTTRAVRDEALPFAQSISPVSKREHLHYIEAFHVDQTEVTLPEGHNPMRRVATRLVNTARQALWVEVGAHGGPGHHVLRRTLEHICGL